MSYSLTGKIKMISIQNFAINFKNSLSKNQEFNDFQKYEKKFKNTLKILNKFYVQRFIDNKPIIKKNYWIITNWEGFKFTNKT